MIRAACAFTAALSLTALPAAGLTPTLDDPLPGFGLETLPSHVVPSQAVATLSDGKSVGNDGFQVRRFWAAGTSNGTLGKFDQIGEAGFVLIDPTETFVIAGQRDSGDIFRFELDLSGGTKLATLSGNFDAAWESPSSIIVSGDVLSRLDLTTGNTTTIALLGGAPGPVAMAPDGGLLVGTRTDQVPAPAGSSAIYRFDPATLANPPAAGYVEQNGLIVIETESVPPVDQWKLENTKTGFAGDGYFRWDGGNFFNTPDVGTLSYTFEVTTGGRYEFVIHNRHDYPESDKENDAWVRMDNGPWLKCFSNGGWQNVGVWNFLSWFDYSGSLPNEQAYFDLTPGQHTLYVSARSYNFHVDRFHLYLDTVSNPWNKDLPETLGGLSLADATLLAGGFTDLRDLLLEGSNDLLIADSDPVAGAGRILFSAGGSAPITLLQADPGEYVDELEFELGGGLEPFQAFQSSEAGTIRYLTVDPAGAHDRVELKPARMQLDLIGPGVSGQGPVEVRVGGGIAGAAALLVWGPASLASSTELPVPGLESIFTGLDLATVQIATGLLPFDASGEVSATFVNGTGQTGIAVLQALLFSPLTLQFVASSEPATL
ncbi:YncE family protein [Engelhardtia mirabilis]|uniref:Uncharacterized protein n=1 Tax=Engelhardtia mirabilis TaxID=2528011 RepID=A0A518BM22_9BACT|nr:hypothetical protein Pla133_31130 [Planctomycetes bacterium Pla133]QDV02348.1 hypothetical protein Pla86_31120 [Planctomycetes bacterium Pla86]